MLLQMLARYTVGGKNQREVFIVKKRALFIVLLAFSLLLAACNGTQKPADGTANGTAADKGTEVTTEMRADGSEDDLSGILDVKMEHQPTEAEILSLGKNLSFSEVIDRLGKPHAKARDSIYPLAFEWTTVEGSIYAISFVRSKPGVFLPETDRLAYATDSIAGAARSVSPDATPNDAPIAADTAAEDAFYDPTLRHCPTPEDVASVKKGMSYAEVVEKLGKPHRPAKHLGRDIPVWITTDQNAYVISFSDSGNSSSGSDGRVVEDEPSLEWP